MEYNKSLSARIRRRNRSNKAGKGEVGQGKHKTFLPKEHYGKLPAKRVPALDKKGKPRKNRDGVIIYETSRMAHIFTQALQLGVCSKHVGSKPLRKLIKAIGRTNEAIGARKAAEKAAMAVADAIK